MSSGRHTLQYRLTAGIILLLAAACVTVAVATFVGLRSYLLDQLDAQLAGSVQRVQEYLGESHDDSGGDRSGPRDDDSGDVPPGDEPRPVELGDVPGLSAGTVAARVTPGRAPTRAYVIAQGWTPLDATTSAVVAAVPADGQPQTQRLDGEAYRVAGFALHDGDTLVVAVPLESLERTTARLLAVEGVLFLVVIGAAGVIGAAFVGRSLAPLRRVAAAATEVVEVPLGSGTVDLPGRVDGLDPQSEVGHVAEALNLLLDHVETSFAQRHATEEQLRRFVADASHELRTPVAVISGYAELAQRQPGDLDAVVAQAVERIATEARRMAVLVDDLLLLARIDAGRPLGREEVDLVRLALEVVDDARVAGPDHRWALDLPEDPVVVTGDPHRLRQVLANLTTNARLHTPAGTTVTVTVTRVDPRWVQVRVADDGPGVPPHLQPSIFERFVRGEAGRSRDTGSTGLGLAIVAAVVAAHHGTVALDSRPGATVVTVSLPSGAAPAEPGPPAAR